ncbi:hypothetical protein V1291_000533 [Nitrobacteraceae bacterium AZCC 1564]
MEKQYWCVPLLLQRWTRESPRDDPTRIWRLDRMLTPLLSSSTEALLGRLAHALEDNIEHQRGLLFGAEANYAGAGDRNFAASASALHHRRRRTTRTTMHSRENDYSGTTRALVLRSALITCGSSFRCACTSSGGVAAIQVSREKSTKRSLLNVSRNLNGVEPVFSR